MHQYTEQEHAADREKILDALDAVYQLRERYKDVIAIPEVITLHDITEYRVATSGEIKQFKTVFGKQAAQVILDYFNSTDYITSENFEDTVMRALSEQHNPGKL